MAAAARWMETRVGDGEEEEGEASKQVGSWFALTLRPTMALYLSLPVCLQQSLKGTLSVPWDRIN